VNTRRRFVKSASSLALGATVAEVGVHASAEPPLYADALQTTSNSLNGVWQFRLDPGKDGEINRWFKPRQTSQGLAERDGSAYLADCIGPASIQRKGRSHTSGV
jgi:hypothetical protein